MHSWELAALPFSLLHDVPVVVSRKREPHEDDFIQQSILSSEFNEKLVQHFSVLTSESLKTASTSSRLASPFSLKMGDL